MMGAPEGNYNSPFSKTRTICWNCRHAVPDGKYGCSWSERFIPVRGWVATKSQTVSNKYGDAYTVYECPEFKEDKHG